MGKGMRLDTRWGSVSQVFVFHAARETRLVSPQPTVPPVLLPPAGSPPNSGGHIASFWQWITSMSDTSRFNPTRITRERTQLCLQHAIKPNFWHCLECGIISGILWGPLTKIVLFTCCIHVNEVIYLPFTQSATNLATVVEERRQPQPYLLSTGTISNPQQLFLVVDYVIIGEFSMKHITLFLAAYFVFNVRMSCKRVQQWL